MPDVKRKHAVSEEDGAKVIKLEPRLGNGDTVTTEDGKTSVDQYLDDQRSKRIKTETEHIRETQGQEMGRDRRKSLKRFGNLPGSVPKSRLTGKEIYEKSSYVKHIIQNGETMKEELDEHGYSERMRKTKSKAEGERRAFEKESRDIWYTTSAIRGQPRTSTPQFILWVLVFNAVVATKQKWIDIINGVLTKWNQGKNAVSFKEIKNNSIYTTLKLLTNKKYAIYALSHVPEKSARVIEVGLDPCVVYIKREHLYVMIAKARKEEGWKLLYRYCDPDDSLYCPEVAEKVALKMGAKPEELGPDLDINEIVDSSIDDDMTGNCVRQLAIALRDNMPDDKLGKLVKDSAIPFANLFNMLFKGIKASGEIEIHLKLKI